jgi:hypothetical protein
LKYSAGHQRDHPNDEVYPSHAWMHELTDSKCALKNSLLHTTVKKNSTQKENDTEEMHKLRIDTLLTQCSEKSPTGAN